MEKEQISGIWFFKGKNVLFKESPPSIMVSRNLNWSTEILWFGTGYVKWKILSPLKRSAWGRLHCWFCLKLLNIYSLCYDDLFIIFLTLAPVNIPPRIIPTLALVKILLQIIPTLALVKIHSYQKISIFSFLFPFLFMILI
jgi:hypothetical protein